MIKINIAGVLVDNITKQEAIDAITQIVRSDKTCYVTTPYSEMIVFAAKDEKYRQALNQAALALPDGIGILWAAKYLSLKSKSVLHAFWQIAYTLAYTLVNPSYARTVIHERIVGSHLIWDIARLAADNNYSVALVGGRNTVAAATAQELKKKFPGLKIALALSDNAFDDMLVSEINQANSDILLIAYQPPKQELWLAENIHKLKVKAAVGLGGTFDYIAGKRLPAPRILQSMGLEWLWRLVTQPWRLRRMWNALPVFIWTVYRYKVKSKM